MLTETASRTNISAHSLLPVCFAASIDNKHRVLINKVSPREKARILQAACTRANASAKIVFAGLQPHRRLERRCSAFRTPSEARKFSLCCSRYTGRSRAHLRLIVTAHQRARSQNATAVDHQKKRRREGARDNKQKRASSLFAWPAAGFMARRDDELKNNKKAAAGARERANDHSPFTLRTRLLVIVFKPSKSSKKIGVRRARDSNCIVTTRTAAATSLEIADAARCAAASFFSRFLTCSESQRRPCQQTRFADTRARATSGALHFAAFAVFRFPRARL